jgi:negative regulator of sigma E activity
MLKVLRAHMNGHTRVYAHAGLTKLEEPFKISMGPVHQWRTQVGVCVCACVCLCTYACVLQGNS